MAYTESTNDSSVECRSVAGFPSYVVGADGVVWCVKSRNGRALVGAPRPVRVAIHSGYARVALKRGRAKNYWRYVHRLVLTAFVGPAPDGMVCCHGDGNRLNNYLSNLRWGTRSENEADKADHGTKLVGSGHHQAKITEADVAAIRNKVAAGRTKQSVADEYGVARSTIGDIVSGRTWQHVPVTPNLVPA